ncbi:unnamed protein product [Vitrella brassicaformis CCMP3155]|uniref:Cytochrome P450 n=1 Tax=Vitrella brassicaformis (strain CCMP3155) TaxID=1169540 RepID=A0A0G4F2U5_VITBC|nr:unnamed protein product [Vitrella brassicaformis CCMP3155]|eukprot:CEM05720.1 unnamed protein product [Vitrella brassicaformis CCMP3155]
MSSPSPSSPGPSPSLSAGLDVASLLLKGGAALGGLMVGYSACRLSYFVCRYVWNSSKYRELPASEESMPVWTAKDPTGKFEDFLESIRDKDKPGQFRKLVDCGPFFDGRRIVLINDPDVFATVLNDLKAFPKYPVHATEVYIGDGLLNAKGAQWHRQRKLLTPLFHFKALKQALPHMVRRVKTVVAQIDQEIDQNTDNRTIRCRDTFNDLALQIMMDCVFPGKFDGPWMMEAWEISTRFSNTYFIGRLILGWPWDLLPLPSALGLHLRVWRIAQRVKAAIRDTKRRLQQQEAEQGSGKVEAGGNLVEMLVSTDGISDHQVLLEALTFLGAGHATTSNMLCWALYHLAKYPDKQAKLHREIDEMFGGEPIAPEDYMRLEYCRAVIKETLRLRPLIAYMERLSHKKIHVDGHTIPPGTAVWLGTYFLHHDERYWEDPEAFMPERWLEEVPDEGPDANPQDSGVTAHHATLTDKMRTAGGRAPRYQAATPFNHPYAYVPFAAGPRNCIGQKFALQESMVILCELFQRFEVSLAGPDRVKAMFPITMIPLNIHIAFKRRTTFYFSNNTHTTSSNTSQASTAPSTPLLPAAAV